MIPPDGPPLTPVLLAGLPAPPFTRRPAALVANAVAAAVLREAPGILERLDGFAGRCVRLDPTDLPFAFEATIATTGIDVSVHTSTSASGTVDAELRGPLARLLACLNGRGDGDALFFSRELDVRGDTELVLAVRNALDDAEIDLARVLPAACGPFAPLARRALAAAEALHARAGRDLDALAAALTAPMRHRLAAQERELGRLRADLDELRRTAGRRRRTREAAP